MVTLSNLQQANAYISSCLTFLLSPCLSHTCTTEVTDQAAGFGFDRLATVLQRESLVVLFQGCCHFLFPCFSFLIVTMTGFPLQFLCGTSDFPLGMVDHILQKVHQCTLIFSLAHPYIQYAYYVCFSFGCVGVELLHLSLCPSVAWYNQLFD